MSTQTIKADDMIGLLYRAAAAIETPDDLTRQEQLDVAADLCMMADTIKAKSETVEYLPDSTA